MLWVSALCGVCAVLWVSAELCEGLRARLYPVPYTALPWAHLGLGKMLCTVVNPLHDKGQLVKSSSIGVTVSQSVGKIDLCRHAKYGQHKSRPIQHPLDSLSVKGNKVSLYRSDLFSPQKSLEGIHGRQAMIMN